MRKSMQSILGILTGTAIAATTMLGLRWLSQAIPNVSRQLEQEEDGISPVVYQLRR